MATPVPPSTLPTPDEFKPLPPAQSLYEPDSYKEAFSVHKDHKNASKVSEVGRPRRCARRHARDGYNVLRGDRTRRFNANTLLLGLADPSSPIHVRVHPRHRSSASNRPATTAASVTSTSKPIESVRSAGWVLSPRVLTAAGAEEEGSREVRERVSSSRSKTNTPLQHPGICTSTTLISSQLTAQRTLCTQRLF